MEIQGQKEDFVPQTHVYLLDRRPQGTRVHLGQNLHFNTSTGTSTSAPRGPGHSLGEALLPFKPLAPPPGIPSPSRLLPTSYPTVGTPMGYNFDPMTGRPLRPLMSSVHSLPSQPLGTFSTPTSPYITGLSTLPGLSREEHPLVVGSLSRSSQVVADGRIPTVTVSSATAGTTLSASSEMAPRISTSCGNAPQGDVCRVIWQHLHSSPSRSLAGAGVGRGLARKPVRVSGSRGQILVEMLTDIGSDRSQALAAKLGEASVGQGQSIPTPPVGRPEQRGSQVDTRTKASLSPPITMHLDHQGSPVTYSEAASRLPQRTVVTSSELPVYDVWLKIAAREEEKEAA